MVIVAKFWQCHRCIQPKYIIVQFLIQASYFEGVGGWISLDYVGDFCYFGEIRFWNMAYEAEQENFCERRLLGELLESGDSGLWLNNNNWFGWYDDRSRAVAVRRVGASTECCFDSGVNRWDAGDAANLAPR